MTFKHLHIDRIALEQPKRLWQVERGSAIGCRLFSSDCCWDTVNFNQKIHHATKR